MRDWSASANGSPGSAVIARPFFDTTTSSENSELVAAPGIASGRVDVISSSQLLGAELHGIWAPNPCSARNFSFLAGVRYLGPDEGLRIEENVVTAKAIGAIPGGTAIFVHDQFDTRNDFVGGQIGFREEVTRGLWVISGSAKVALGNTHQQSWIQGFTTTQAPGGAQVAAPGGLLALPSNNGTLSRDAFSVVPEFQLNIGYQVTSQLRATFGYTFLYWSDVARPGDQVNRNINPTQVRRMPPRAGSSRERRSPCRNCATPTSGPKGLTSGCSIGTILYAFRSDTSFQV